MPIEIHTGLPRAKPVRYYARGQNVNLMREQSLETQSPGTHSSWNAFDREYCRLMGSLMYACPLAVLGRRAAMRAVSAMAAVAVVIVVVVDILFPLLQICGRDYGYWD